MVMDQRVRQTQGERERCFFVMLHLSTTYEREREREKVWVFV